MVPASGCSTPPTRFIVVDLPEPFSPTRPSSAPASRVRCTPCSTSTPKKLLLRFSTLSRGMTVSSAAGDAGAGGIDDGGEQDDGTLDGEDHEQGEAHQLEALVEQHQEQHAEHRPDHLALAPEQAGAADDCGADDVEQDV